MSFSRVSGEISFQAKSNYFSSIFMLVARSIESSLLFKIAKRFSMGFKFGELGGHMSLVQNPGMYFLAIPDFFLRMWRGPILLKNCFGPFWQQFSLQNST